MLFVKLLYSMTTVGFTVLTLDPKAAVKVEIVGKCYYVYVLLSEI